MLSRLPLLLSDGRRSGGGLLPLPAGAGLYDEDVLPPRAELLCQLSRRARSRLGASRSGRPKVFSRIAVLPGRPPVIAASRLGRVLLSKKAETVSWCYILRCNFELAKLNIGLIQHTLADLQTCWQHGRWVQVQVSLPREANCEVEL